MPQGKLPRGIFCMGVLWLRQLFSYFSSDTVDVPFKVTVVDKLGEDVLHKGRNGAGIKAELFGINLCKMLR